MTLEFRWSRVGYRIEVYKKHISLTLNNSRYKIRCVKFISVNLRSDRFSCLIGVDGIEGADWSIYTRLTL